MTRSKGGKGVYLVEWPPNKGYAKPITPINLLCIVTRIFQQRAIQRGVCLLVLPVEASQAGWIMSYDCDWLINQPRVVVYPFSSLLLQKQRLPSQGDDQLAIRRLHPCCSSTSSSLLRPFITTSAGRQLPLLIRSRPPLVRGLH